MSYPRPLSPHLQIYKPQLTSVLSITHRATGIALSFGVFPLIHWLWAIGEGREAYTFAINLYSSWLGLFCLLGWSFCFFYHLTNGIRHMAWDMGYGLGLRETYLTGWMVVGGSIILTILSWGIGLMFLGSLS